MSFGLIYYSEYDIIVHDGIRVHSVRNPPLPKPLTRPKKRSRVHGSTVPSFDGILVRYANEHADVAHNSTRGFHTVADNSNISLIEQAAGGDDDDSLAKERRGPEYTRSKTPRSLRLKPHSVRPLLCLIYVLKKNRRLRSWRKSSIDRGLRVPCCVGLNAPYCCGSTDVLLVLWSLECVVAGLSLRVLSQHPANGIAHGVQEAATTTGCFYVFYAYTFEHYNNRFPRKPRRSPLVPRRVLPSDKRVLHGYRTMQ